MGRGQVMNGEGLSSSDLSSRTILEDLTLTQVFWSGRPVKGGASMTHSEAPPTKMSEIPALIFISKKKNHNL